jgi:hypothetical protein
MTYSTLRKYGAEQQLGRLATNRPSDATTSAMYDHLQVKDLVLRRFESREGKNKLSPMWEEPFRVTEERWLGAFWLSDEDGVPVPNVWNIEHLCKFYP